MSIQQLLFLALTYLSAGGYCYAQTSAPAASDAAGSHNTKFYVGTKPERPYRGFWELTGSVTADFGLTYPYNRVSYHVADEVRPPQGGYYYYGAIRNFVTTEGEVIPVRYAGNDYPDRATGSRGYSQFLRGGIQRQSRWGGAVLLNVGFARQGGKVRIEDLPNAPAQAEYLVHSAYKEVALTTELGFQYTFFRRRRVRPYLGVGLINFLYYYGEEDSIGRDLATGQERLQRRFFSREYFPMYPDLTITAGLQVTVTKQLSLGVYTWANSASNIWIEAPVGIEGRFRL